MRIMVIDDSDTQRVIIKAILAEHLPKATVVDFGNGEEAIKSLRENPAQLILCDINMEPVSGFDVLDEAKRQEVKHFAFISSNLTEDFKEKTQKAGVKYYITKPVTEEKIKSLLSNLGVLH